MGVTDGKFGNALKNARNEKKLTQEKLAEMVGITPTHLKQLESERRNPSIDVLFKLAMALTLSLDSLMSEYPDDTVQELRRKVDLCLDRINGQDLSIIFATLEAMLERDQLSKGQPDKVQPDKAQPGKNQLDNDQPGMDL